MAFYVETLQGGIPIARWDKPLRTGGDFEAMFRELAEQRAAHAPSEPPVRTVLDSGEIAQLAEQYPRGSMSQEQYDGLLEDLVDRGVLTRDEIEHMGYRGMVCVPLGTQGWTCRCDEAGNPLADIYGNSLGWTKRLAGYLPTGLLSGVTNVLLFSADHRDAFNALDAILARMDHSRSQWPA